MGTVDANPFGPGLLRFLRDLERDNDRDWFETHRDRYETEVREPALAFIRSMARHVEAISPHLTAEARKVGGSLMRVHRDVRFSRDKRPYKTNLGIQFRHAGGRDVHAPGLYVHVEPGSMFLAAGMWRPDAPSLRAIRTAIAADPRGWTRVRDGAAFRKDWDLEGDSLRRVPRGWPADHPMAEDLRRTDHIAVHAMTPRDVVRGDLVAHVAATFRRTRAYLAWLTGAVGLPF